MFQCVRHTDPAGGSGVGGCKPARVLLQRGCVFSVAMPTGGEAKAEKGQSAQRPQEAGQQAREGPDSWSPR